MTKQQNTWIMIICKCNIRDVPVAFVLPFLREADNQILLHVSMYYMF
uniref:Uncharacterized protein n=1 Tax=Amphimedon queenslandica TaxID=400682 RepID=A0A1X7UIH9_AMPQE